MPLLQSPFVKNEVKKSMLKPLSLSLALLAVAVLSGCASRPEVQATHAMKAPDYYTVRSGDTLSGIASRYGLNYITVAQMNGIAPPYIIYLNQSLRLKGSTDNSRVVTQPMQNTPSIQRQRIPLPSQQAAATAASNTIANTSAPVISNPAAPLKWVRPANGAIVDNFNLANNIKGIRFAGQQGDPVFAAADGQVVYADSGLKEYGNLILIKHRNGYISAYAYNSKLLVKSGMAVSVGQKIAEMGSTGNANRVMLEFQIRADGKPIDPMQVIPRS
ncbi:peptidoglycan DD-metalloendopeptidase family protein [Acinetobacter sp. MD2]|uniref:peptidoglycan DD-metalloendopeptidase family protein n=1 Tax=Acinetobacter sp. MD2 TaxID=2600066 RepID=UPI002D1EF8AF|nr:peptidoglycan DD-metalloendopeptidase family protein [Acinetobacter sp. MD2]MEB3766436.1 peptidoglycan DD-metalloendopeptidase family protein [Acinetobacter sp. MD2]